jgi:hypothetical protein
MKRFALLLTIMIAAAALAVPAYAMGGGMSGGMGGSGMMGSIGSGLFDWFQKWRNGSQYTDQAGQDRKDMEALNRQHNEDSAYLQYQIRMKEKQLDALLDSSDPDIQEARALRKGIRELREEAEQEQHNYEVEAGKMNRSYRSGNTDGSNFPGSPGGSGSGGMAYGGGGMGNGGRMGGGY